MLSAATWSEWRDLNPRSLGPEPSAIPSFATPGCSLFIIDLNLTSVKVNIPLPRCIPFFGMKSREGRGTEMERRYAGHDTDKREKRQREWERLQLGRLLCVFLLFLTVVLGKRICPERMVTAGERVMDVLNQNLDLEEVFARLGDSITGEGGAMEGLGAFCVAVFGGQPLSAEELTEEQAVRLPPIPPANYSGLLKEHLEEIRYWKIPEKIQEASPVVGTVLEVGQESETAFPEGCTADKLSFGDLETVSPVVGNLNSGFGYREHPVKGNLCFHGGADISAREGDPIGAFADGVVEYIGEDASYGRYLQLDHGNGVKSFYAHCQTLCAETGEQVTAGETIATVGATGTATGPHLHLELKCCGVRVDPAYYVDLL